MSTQLSRRTFIKVSAVGGGLLLGFELPAVPKIGAQTPEATFIPNAYLRITSDDTITIMVHRSEMGQGVQTAIPMILADELEADWTRVHLEQAPADSTYGDQVTGGSVSISSSYGTLRIAGATARTMLIAAAAQIWNVDPAACRAENSRVIHEEKQLSYGELTATAAALPIPRRQELQLKDSSAFRLIGTSIPNVLTPQYVDGTAQYAIDVRLPGMLYAAVARCPVFGGRVESYDDSRTKAFEGVRHIVEIESGVAVVADNSWAALKGRDLLDITWDEGAFVAQNDDTLLQAFAAEIPSAEVAPAIEAIYFTPYLAHATMEPMNCTADVRPDGCDVWAPTQDRQQAKLVAISLTGLNRDVVNIHVPPIGCGLGRRLKVDYVEEAVQISKLVSVPIKLLWSRADDIQNGAYRPATYHVLRATLDEQGRPNHYEHHIVGQPVAAASDLAYGASDHPYDLGDSVVRAHSVMLPIPTAYFRSVSNPTSAFAREAFVDEMAELAGQDPYEYRMALLRNERFKVVLESAARAASWGNPLPEGHAHGIAFHTTWGIPVAQVAEVSISQDKPHIHRIVCAIDCGLVINPDMVVAQMESGIAVGLSSLFNAITFENGRVQEGNFHEYPLLEMKAMPVVEVHIVPSTAMPEGVGEMGIPPVVPAVINALYKLTGKRIRQLPIQGDVF
ncbi:MAG: xanthine dehydrogenase family protein molybdopterin-binding subunit [Chloroflexi bacterium]|nr:xanthine dehydrogenase family protein molybdopterin-binding subunit [Chloroflexota bacterium]